MIRRSLSFNRYGAESDGDRLRSRSPAASRLGARPLSALGLEPRRYFLYVSRFEPENNPRRVAEAYRASRRRPAVGDGRRRSLRQPPTSAASPKAPIPRVLFPGPIYGKRLPRAALQRYLAYVHATEVGGTHPALVEAMGYGNSPSSSTKPPRTARWQAHVALYFEASHDPATLVERPGSGRSIAPASAESVAASCAARTGG